MARIRKGEDEGKTKKTRTRHGGKHVKYRPLDTAHSRHRSLVETRLVQSGDPRLSLSLSLCLSVALSLFIQFDPYYATSTTSQYLVPPPFSPGAWRRLSYARQRQTFSIRGSHSSF